MNKLGRIDPYLMFGGRCEEAAKFYGKIWGVEPKIMKFGDMPDEMPGMDPDKVMHANLNFDDGTMLMLSDGVDDKPFNSDNFSITWSCTDHEHVMQIWKAFIDAGSKVTMEIGPVFWAKQYGQLTDPFGVSWMIMEYEEGAAA